jgi:hypothetical protein
MKSSPVMPRKGWPQLHEKARPQSGCLVTARTRRNSPFKGDSRQRPAPIRIIWDWTPSGKVWLALPGGEGGEYDRAEVKRVAHDQKALHKLFWRLF